MRYTYPDEGEDVEAMYVAQNGDVVVVSKRPLPRRGQWASPGSRISKFPHHGGEPTVVSWRS